MGKLARNHSGKKGEVIQSSKNNRTQPPDSLAPPNRSMYKYTVYKITRLFFVVVIFFTTGKLPWVIISKILSVLQKNIYSEKVY